jgi:hypothetical protein
MRQGQTSSPDRLQNLLSRIFAERKKAMAATCLIALMALMWIRVLTKGEPKAAQARPVGDQGQSDNRANSQLNVSFVELPKVKGRHDVITRDFFAPESWWKAVESRNGQSSSGGDDVSVVSAQGDQEVITLVSARLKLEAIASGHHPRAFINGKLLAVGDRLPIKEGTRTFECEVIQIQQNAVVIRCGQAEMTLKLRQVTDVIE